MRQFKHTIITYNHLLGLNVDGDLDELIEDPELAGKDQDSLKSMLAIVFNFNEK